MTKSTDAQVDALWKLWKRAHQDKTFAQLMQSAQPTMAMDGAIVVPWCNMFVAIETDGYTHS